MNELVPASLNPFAIATFADAVRLAEIMATAKLVPKHLQGDPGSCLMIIEHAMRWRMSPFAVAQCTSLISGKLMFEGKLVAAAVEAMGAIAGGFDYKFSGEGEDRQVTVAARRPNDVNPRQLTVRLKDVRTSNEWWDRQPDQQLVYSGTRAWARRYTPKAILGVYAPEEFDRATGEIRPGVDPGPTIEGEAETPSQDAPKGPPPPPPPPRPEAPEEPPKAAKTQAKGKGNGNGMKPEEVHFLTGIADALAGVHTRGDAEAMLEKFNRTTVGPNVSAAARERFGAMKAALVERWFPFPGDQP